MEANGIADRTSRLPQLPFIVKARFVSAKAEYVDLSISWILINLLPQGQNQGGWWCCIIDCMNLSAALFHYSFFFHP
jgi:hypothetical protein